jgi:hypothetical protein
MGRGVPRRLALIVGVFGVFGCTRAKPTADTTDSATSTTSAEEIQRDATTVDAKLGSGLESWTGAYVSRPGSLYVVDGGEWAGVKWRGDDAGVGLGEGSMTLTVNRSTGEVRGAGEGPIGRVLFSGVVADDALTMSVGRQDPMDRGLTGTAVAKVSGDKMTGTMRLSVADARVIREATLVLSLR